jgi:hypothetical protein
MTFANPDFWDHLPANKSGAWHRFSQNNLKYMVKQEYSMECQLQESATITADHRQLLEFCSVTKIAISTAQTAMKNKLFAQSIYPCMLLYQVGATCSRDWTHLIYFQACQEDLLLHLSSSHIRHHQNTR